MPNALPSTNQLKKENIDIFCSIVKLEALIKP
jgi:hypothetical protein